MTTFNWQLHTPIDAFIFDCDGTLSTLEGINELAKCNGVGKEVSSLTTTAMSTAGMSAALYQKRLDLVQPRLEQVMALGKKYLTHQVADASAVIALLSRLNKAIYLISAGLYPAIKFFGEQLNILLQHIFAVDIQFDVNGHYIDFERQSPLVTRYGKCDIVTQLKKQHQTTLYVGDGLNDYMVYDLVTRFVGFGGVYYRQNIAENCEYYIKAASMAPLLPLSLTENECAQLTAGEKTLYQKGLDAILSGEIETRSSNTKHSPE